MGMANAQRMLDYIRTLAQFISQPEYLPVVPLFGFINEPNGPALGKFPIASFYLEAYTVIREVTGIGTGNGPVLSMHDGFLGTANWYTFLPGADRLAIDQHTYVVSNLACPQRMLMCQVFGNQLIGSLESIARDPCQYWGVSTNTTSQQWGINIAGEFSAAINE